VTPVSDFDQMVLRAWPQATDKYLSFCPRTPVFRADVGTISYDADSHGAYELTYANTVLGAYQNISAGLTVDFWGIKWLTDEPYLLGSARIRKNATSTKIFIGDIAQGELNLDAAQYFVVVNERRIWQRLPMLREGKINSANYYNSFAVYKDFDLAYTDEHLAFRPVINVAYKPAGWCDLGGYRSVRLDASQCYSLATSASVSSILWHLDDCALQPGYALTDWVIEILAPAGFRYISATVTDTAGKQSTRYVPVWAHDATYPPVVPTDITRDTADWNSSREMEFTFVGEHGEYAPDKLPKGTHVCYWEDAIFAEEPAPESYRGYFVGWANKESSLIQKGAGEYRLSVAGPAWWLDQIDGFLDMFFYRPSPATWYEMAGPTDERAIFSLLKYNSTALDLINLHVAGIVDVWGQEAGSDYAAIKAAQSSLWKQISTLAQAWCGFPACTSDGALYLRKHPSLMDTYSYPNRDDLETHIHLTPQDWTLEDGLEVFDDFVPKVGQVEMEGNTFDGTTSTRLRVRAPGRTPSWAAGKEVPPLQILSSNMLTATNQLRSRAGNWFAWVNNANADMPIQLLGNLDVFEPALRQIVTLEAAADNPRGLSLQDAQFVVKQVSVQHAKEIGQPGKMISLTLEAVTEGERGESMPIETQSTIPTDYVPPEDLYPGSNTGGSGDNGGYGSGKGSAIMALALYTPSPNVRSASIILKTNSLVPPVVWEVVHTGLPAHPDGYSGVVNRVHACYLDPYDPGTCVIASDAGVYYNSSWKTGGSWQVVATTDQLKAAVIAKNGAMADTWYPAQIAMTPAQSGLIYVAGSHTLFPTVCASIVRIQGYKSASPVLTASYGLALSTGTNRYPEFKGPMDGLNGAIAVSVTDPDYLLIAGHMGSYHPIDQNRWGVWGGSFNSPNLGSDGITTRWFGKWSVTDTYATVNEWWGVFPYIPMFKTADGAYNENTEFFVAAEGKIWRCTTSALNSWLQWSDLGPRIDATRTDRRGGRIDMMENSHAGLPMYFLRNESQSDAQTSMYIGDPVGGWTEVPLPTDIPVVGWQGGWPAADSQYYIGAQVVNLERLVARGGTLLMMTEDQWTTPLNLTGNAWSLIPSALPWKAGVVRMTPHWKE